MANVNTWSGVTVSIQSALGTAVSIASITKAATGVVSTDYGSPSPAGHGYTTGQYILLDTLGMDQVDNRPFRVATPTTYTFQLEGENTTNYNTFSSGTAQLITFGTTINTITGLSGSGGDFDFIDTTTIHQTARTQIPGPSAPGTYTCESIWDPSDSGLIALKAASDAKQVRAIMFAFSSGAKVVFNGYVACSMIPTGSALDKVITPIAITMFGTPTAYAT
jgi:Phage tail tube protein, TTP